MSVERGSGNERVQMFLIGADENSMVKAMLDFSANGTSTHLIIRTSGANDTPTASVGHDIIERLHEALVMLHIDHSAQTCSTPNGRRTDAILIPLRSKLPTE